MEWSRWSGDPKTHSENNSTKTLQFNAWEFFEEMRKA